MIGTLVKYGIILGGGWLAIHTLQKASGISQLINGLKYTPSGGGGLSVSGGNALFFVDLKLQNTTDQQLSIGIDEVRLKEGAETIGTATADPQTVHVTPQGISIIRFNAVLPLKGALMNIVSHGFNYSGKSLEIIFNKAGQTFPYKVPLSKFFEA